MANDEVKNENNFFNKCISFFNYESIKLNSVYLIKLLNEKDITNLDEQVQKLDLGQKFYNKTIKKSFKFDKVPEKCKEIYESIKNYFELIKTDPEKALELYSNKVDNEILDLHLKLKKQISNDSIQKEQEFYKKLNDSLDILLIMACYNKLKIKK
jgi:hypothetical protein